MEAQSPRATEMAARTSKSRIPIVTHHNVDSVYFKNKWLF
jgi:hypothetical protein